MHLQLSADSPRLQAANVFVSVSMKTSSNFFRLHACKKALNLFVPLVRYDPVFCYLLDFKERDTYYF